MNQLPWSKSTFAYKAAEQEITEKLKTNQAQFPTKESQVEFSKSSKQKFFLQYGRLWCQVMKEDATKRNLKEDPHSPGIARINAQMPHQSGFTEAFNCKKGDPHYFDSKNAVVVW